MLQTAEDAYNIVDKREIIGKDYVRVIYGDGRVFMGEINEQNEPNGYGTMETGKVSLECFWEKGLPNGPGILRTDGLETTFGRWENGVLGEKLAEQQVKKALLDGRQNCSGEKTEAEVSENGKILGDELESATKDLEGVLEGKIDAKATAI